MDDLLPEGLIPLSVLGVASEQGDVEADEDAYALADLIVRCTGVIIRHAAQQPDWTEDNIPYEVRVVAISFARRVFNNPQNIQRIQTGPLGESYHPDELTGLELKESEEELLATFVPEVDGDLGSLGIIAVVRPDKMREPANSLTVYTQGFSNGHKTIVPSLADYLGVA